MHGEDTLANLIFQEDLQGVMVPQPESRALRLQPAGAAAVVLKGLVAAEHGDGAVAQKELERAVRENPNELEIRHTLCRFLFERAAPVEAERALDELIRIDCGNAAAHHNLGTVSMRLGRYSEAVEAYRTSLRHRPNSLDTYLQLGNALKECGQLKEAIDAWK